MVEAISMASDDEGALLMPIFPLTNRVELRDASPPTKRFEFPEISPPEITDSSVSMFFFYN